MKKKATINRYVFSSYDEVIRAVRDGLNVYVTIMVSEDVQADFCLYIEDDDVPYNERVVGISYEYAGCIYDYDIEAFFCDDVYYY